MPLLGPCDPLSVGHHTLLLPDGRIWTYWTHWFFVILHYLHPQLTLYYITASSYPSYRTLWCPPCGSMPPPVYYLEPDSLYYVVLNRLVLFFHYRPLPGPQLQLPPPCLPLLPHLPPHVCASHTTAFLGLAKPTGLLHPMPVHNLQAEKHLPYSCCTLPCTLPHSYASTTEPPTGHYAAL